MTQETMPAERLRRAGYEPGPLLGAGMEGTVFELGAERVIKIWHRRTPSEIENLRDFYARVARLGLAVTTPQIEAVLDLDGTLATIESRLVGTPSASQLDRPS